MQVMQLHIDATLNTDHNFLMSKVCKSITYPGLLNVQTDTHNQ